MKNDLNFIFIGPSKTGSTWFFELLLSHPQVFVPVAKDLYFFDKNFERGLRWYAAHFTRPSGQIAGEVCHDYFSSEPALQRISVAYPYIKLVCCLRDPYERAFSSMEFIRRNGLTQHATIAETARVHQEVIDESLYYRHLQTVFRYFAPDHVLVLFFEDLRNDPAGVARRLFDFIGVDPDFVSPVLGRVINRRASPRSPTMARVAKHMALFLRAIGYLNLLGRLKRSTFLRRALFVESTSTDYDLNAEDLSYLRPIFEAEIRGIENMLGLNLKHWKRIDPDHES